MPGGAALLVVPHLLQLPLYISAPAAEHWGIAERRVLQLAQQEAFAEPATPQK